MTEWFNLGRICSVRELWLLPLRGGGRGRRSAVSQRDFFPPAPASPPLTFGGLPLLLGAGASTSSSSVSISSSLFIRPSVISSTSISPSSSSPSGRLATSSSPLR
eukprot:CAMPEP_0173184716 /NCGR_PEP_ID=MMETSP1141-20130122/9127_1 /TAXON_ID=483371 /ORGANISM="non described non described, Strain CCMP2298" /LENGTH=104 /DNA_ID=CAMNT_0014108111 /DNA_START=29 /DNA_END=343 /DNA_ORIENTATION=+